VLQARLDEQESVWLRERTGGETRRLCGIIPVMLTSVARAAVIAVVAIAQR
jgi:hypothetical protein